MLIHLTFPKKLRLLTYKDFSLVFKTKEVFYISQVNIFVKLNNLDHPRIGIIIPKKSVKLSHDRNHIKRTVRESFRVNQYKLPYIDIIFFFKKNINNNFKNLKSFSDNIWFSQCFI